MNKKRNGSLDFWKFIFSILIVVFHGKNLSNGEPWLFLGGSIGVEFFFIVSGVLMANSAARRTDDSISLGQDTFHFMQRKITGLLPNIYIAWLIAFVVEHIGNFSLKPMLKDAVNAIWELLFVTESGLLSYSANAVCWYISAMLLAMLILYPLLRKYKDSFFYIIAPLLVIFIMGITYQQWGSLRTPHAWRGYFYKSMIRAIMGITIGCLCFKISEYIRSWDYKKPMQVFWTLLEWVGYGSVILWSYNHGANKMDWILVLLLAVAITVTFSRVSMTDAVFSNYKIFNWLGEFSFSLFLGHGYWSHKMNYLFPNLSYYQRLPIYFAFSIVTGLVIMYSSIGLSNWWKKTGSKWKSYLIAEKEVLAEGDCK